ncbi:ATP-binding protein [candidate division KSB1 bacterium]|nr:ATP-binding protein [candidate division KSB1 bacterium]
MDSKKIAYEPIAGFDNVVRIPLEDIDDTHIVFQVLQDSFEICFRDGKTRIVVDLQNVQFPTASLIALLVEATSRARRLNGDVKIIHLSKSAKNNLVTFSPTSYLSLETEEKFALEDFQETFVPQDEILESTRDEIIDVPQQEINGPVPEETYASIPDETPEQVEDKTTPIEDQTSPTVDIVEDPFIEQLEGTFQNLKAQSEPNIKETEQEEVPEPPVAPEPRKIPGVAETPDPQETYEDKRHHLRVKSIPKNLYSICDFVMDYAEKVGFDKKEVGKIKIAVYEASLNIVEHSYHSNPENWIDVWVEVDSQKITIEIQDYGYSFEGINKKRYDVQSAMNKAQTGGFGLYIIRRSMDEIEYHPDEEQGNRLIMIKYLKPS